ncbi:MAG: type II toxin-antitoxin system VapC family toxin [Acidobacteriaceae bacterium]|nr:type II toxin-antitoxin system VapC family toxin [Acidobacteriaceae bacterium]
MVYVDSSLIVSIYIADSHSPQADRRMAGRQGLWLTPLHRTEFVHAVEQSVFRGRVSAADARLIHDEFEMDRRNGVWLDVNLPQATMESSIRVARSYVASMGSRTLDTLHVASALELKATRFWTFDDRQAKLAKAVGL